MISWLSEKSLNKTIFVFAIIILSISSFMLGVSKVLEMILMCGIGSGSSMEPTLNDGAKLIVSLKENKNLKRGDLIGIKVYDYENNNTPEIIGKRIIALPNESISIKKDKVYINGNLLDEPYAYYSGDSDDNLFITLNDDEYFVMGDNRLDSADSRLIGPIPKKSILYKILLYRN